MSHSSERTVTPPSSLKDRGADGTVSPSRLAKFWCVHPNTIYRDIHKGALRAFRLPGGQLRIRVSDARRYGRPVE